MSKYNRVLIKLSGETLQNKEKGLCIDPGIISGVASRIKTITDMGTEVAIVVGGGNIFRGLSGEARGIDRSSGDYMGMMATIINALALQNSLEAASVPTRVMTALDMQKIGEPFILRRALRHLDKKRVLIFGGGTGNPYFSTDTAAALRGSEIGVDAILKATKVDGVYDSDPMENPDAKRYDRITYSEALGSQLKIMDASAFSLCMENSIPIIVFNFFEEGSIEGIIKGEDIGTLVTSD